RRPDIPARVVVSEYVGVANAFVDREETGMVNAVLDALARRFRPGEVSPATGRPGGPQRGSFPRCRAEKNLPGLRRGPTDRAAFPPTRHSSGRARARGRRRGRHGTARP